MCGPQVMKYGSFGGESGTGGSSPKASVSLPTAPLSLIILGSVMYSYNAECVHKQSVYRKRCFENGVSLWSLNQMNISETCGPIKGLGPLLHIMNSFIVLLPLKINQK
jgi:hypothetical protein